MRVCEPHSGEVMTVRRLTIELKEPTRDGDTALHLLSNVPAEEAQACTLATLYGKRWTIETAFFEITMTLSCEINTLGYPKAALFAFCLALLAYNAVSVIKAALRRAHGRQKVQEEVSGYYLSGSCWIPGSYTPRKGLKHLILNNFSQGCRIGRGPRGKPVKTICYDKLDQLRPWNPI